MGRLETIGRCNAMPMTTCAWYVLVCPLKYGEVCLHTLKYGGVNLYTFQDLSPPFLFVDGLCWCAPFFTSSLSAATLSCLCVLHIIKLNTDDFMNKFTVKTVMIRQVCMCVVPCICLRCFVLVLCCTAYHILSRSN